MNHPEVKKCLPGAGGTPKKERKILPRVMCGLPPVYPRVADGKTEEGEFVFGGKKQPAANAPPPPPPPPTTQPQSLQVTAELVEQVLRILQAGGVSVPTPTHTGDATPATRQSEAPQQTGPATPRDTRATARIQTPQRGPQEPRRETPTQRLPVPQPSVPPGFRLVPARASTPPRWQREATALAATTTGAANRVPTPQQRTPATSRSATPQHNIASQNVAPPRYNAARPSLVTPLLVPVPPRDGRTYAQATRSTTPTPHNTPNATVTSATRQATPPTWATRTPTATPHRAPSPTVRLPTRTVPPAILTEEQRKADPEFHQVRTQNQRHRRMLEALVTSMKEAEVTAANYETFYMYAKVLAEHAEMGREGLRRHFSLLADNYPKAHPVDRPYWYCQGQTPEGRPCTYAHEHEAVMRSHIAKRHEGQKVEMKQRVLSSYSGGAHNGRSTCAVTTAAAMWSTRPDARRDTATWAAFKKSTPTATKAMLHDLRLAVPTTARRALEAVVAREAATTSDDQEAHQKLILVSGRVDRAVGAADVAVQLLKMVTEKHDEDAYEDATEVAFNILAPAGATGIEGVPRIPEKIELPSASTKPTIELNLHAVASATEPTHLIAAVREVHNRRGVEMTTWHRYDGAVHTTSPTAPPSNSAVMLLYTRTPTTPDEHEQQTPAEADGDNEDDAYSFLSDDSDTEDRVPEDIDDRTSTSFTQESPPQNTAEDGEHVFGGHVDPAVLGDWSEEDDSPEQETTDPTQRERTAAKTERHRSMTKFLERLAQHESTTHSPTPPGDVIRATIEEDEASGALFACGIETARTCRSCGYQVDAEVLDDIAVVTATSTALRHDNLSTQQLDDAINQHTIYSPEECTRCGRETASATHRLIQWAVAVVLPDEEDTTQTTEERHLPRTVMTTNGDGTQCTLYLVAMANIHANRTTEVWEMMARNSNGSEQWRRCGHINEEDQQTETVRRGNVLVYSRDAPAAVTVVTAAARSTSTAEESTVLTNVTTPQPAATSEYRQGTCVAQDAKQTQRETPTPQRSLEGILEEVAGVRPRSAMSNIEAVRQMLCSIAGGKMRAPDGTSVNQAFTTLASQTLEWRTAFADNGWTKHACAACGALQGHKPLDPQLSIVKVTIQTAEELATTNLTTALGIRKTQTDVACPVCDARMQATIQNVPGKAVMFSIEEVTATGNRITTRVAPPTFTHKAPNGAEVTRSLLAVIDTTTGPEVQVHRVTANWGTAAQRWCKVLPEGREQEIELAAPPKGNLLCYLSHKPRGAQTAQRTDGDDHRDTNNEEISSPSHQASTKRERPPSSTTTPPSMKPSSCGEVKTGTTPGRQRQPHNREGEQGRDAPHVPTYPTESAANGSASTRQREEQRGPTGGATSTDPVIINSSTAFSMVEDTAATPIQRTMSFTLDPFSPEDENAAAPDPFLASIVQEVDEESQGATEAAPGTDGRRSGATETPTRNLFEAEGVPLPASIIDVDDGAEEDAPHAQSSGQQAPTATAFPQREQTAPPPDARRCPLCPHTPKNPSTPKPQRFQQLCSHMNTKHHVAEVTEAVLEAAGLERCSRCQQFLRRTQRAREAHRCEPQAGTPTQGEEGGEAPHGVPRAAATVRDFRHDSPTADDTEWLATTSSTVRHLHKKEWGHWLVTVGTVLTGYTASVEEERWRRQLAMTTVVRENLSRQRRGDGDTSRAQRQRSEANAAPQGRGGETTATQPHRAITEENWGQDRAAEEEGQLPQQHEEMTVEAEREEQNRKRILNQLSLGALGKAARSLFNTQLPRATIDEARPQLEALHPQAPVSELPLPNETPFLHAVKPERVRAVITKQLGRAAAPGLDGWTRELLVPITEDKGLLTELTALVQDILVGNVHPSFATRIRACILHPFRKEAGSAKVRPITPESALMKLAAHIALDSVEKSFRSTFKGWQYGVWGDSTEAVKRIREAYAEAASDTLVALDATNAYNRMSRRHILEAAYAQPELRFAFGVVNLSLGAAGELALYENGAKIHALKSTEGVRQGMVLSPLLFANAMSGIIRPLMEMHPRVKVVAYLDDVTLIGPHAAVQDFLAEAGPQLSRVGFDINPAKSHHLAKVEVPEALSVSGRTIPVSEGVVRILGAGFRGDAASVEEWVWEKTKAHDHYFEKLQSEWLPRLARLQLLRGSTVPRLNHLLRTHKPEELNRSTTWFDERVMETALDIANIGDRRSAGDGDPGHTPPDPLRETKLLIRLPMAMGGLGLRSQKTIAEFAAECVGTRNAQRERTAVVDVEIEKSLHSLLSEPALLLLDANTATGATRALVDPAVQMSDRAAEVMLKQRLFQRVLPEGWQCACGEDATNEHIHRCRQAEGGAKIARHNKVRDTVIGWATEIGYVARAEPPTQNQLATTIENSHRRRLDVEITTPNGTFTTDVTVTYPGRTGLGTHAVQEAHTNKLAKHGDDARAQDKIFAPLALESTGGIHKDGFQWMRRLAGIKPHPYTPNTALSMLLTKVAQALHEGNAYMFHVADQAHKHRQLGRSVGEVQE